MYVVFMALINPKGVIKVIVSSFVIGNPDQRGEIIPLECRLSGNYRSN